MSTIYSSVLQLPVEMLPSLFADSEASNLLTGVDEECIELPAISARTVNSWLSKAGGIGRLLPQVVHDIRFKNSRTKVLVSRCGERYRAFFEEGQKAAQDR